MADEWTVVRETPASEWVVTQEKPQRSASESAEQPLPPTKAQPQAQTGPQPPSAAREYFVPTKPPGTITDDTGQELRLDETGAWVPVNQPSLGGPLKRMVGAAAEAYQNSPPILTPQARYETERQGPMGRFIVSPLAQAGGAVLGGMNALAAGGMAGIAEAATASGAPEFGRDVNQMIQLMPEIMRMGIMGAPPGTVAPKPPGPRFASEIPAHPSEPPPVWRPVAPGEEPVYGREYRMNQETGQREVNVGGPVVQSRGSPSVRGVTEPEASAPQPQPPSAPQPAGAQATPSSQSGLSAAEAADYGSAADKQWLYKSMVPGEVSDIEYIKGIKPTMAQREQTVIRARETKNLRNLSEEAAQAERELLAEHNDIRKRDFQETAGSDVTQGIKKRAADDAIDKELGAAFRAGGKVDAQPIVDAIEAELNSPSGKLPNVRAALKEVRDALNTRDGSALETNPQQVYGARRVINLLQSKEGRAEKPTYASDDVQAALISVKGVIDGAIEPAAPGFRQAIANYAEAQRALEANEILQTWEPKLYDSQGRMQFLPFHKMMNDAVKMRDPNVRPNHWQSLTEEQWNRLKSTHDDLMRVASAEDLAKAAGSDSIQNAAGLARRAVQAGAGNVAGVVAGMAVPPIVAAPVGMVTKGFVDRLFSAGAQRRAQRDMNQMLRPDPTQYPTRPNPLMGPLEP